MKIFQNVSKPAVIGSLLVILAVGLVIGRIVGGNLLTRTTPQLPNITLPKDLAWGMSVAQVKAQESGYFETEKPETLIYKSTFLSYPAAAGYYFDRNALVGVQYTALRKKDSPPEEYARLCREEFTALEQYFEQLYGPPARMQTEQTQERIYFGQTILTLKLNLRTPFWSIVYQPAAALPVMSAEDAFSQASQES